VGTASPSTRAARDDEDGEVPGVEQVTQQAAAHAVRTATGGGLAYWFAKRLIDIGGSAILLVLLSPVFLLIALAIWLDTGLPIIYRCQRIGHYGQLITVLKFRTMRDGSHRHLEELLSVDEELRLEYGRRRKLRDDPRRTRVGAILRRTSLDELPQLLNVLSGEMSLVGPRPYFPGELAGRPEAKVILSVQPGITGLWQVNGRNDRTFEERLGFDVDYVTRRGFGLDVRILVGTLSAVVTRKGAY
jgi:lipopolysaccharide/colanic/teichoic acid biosynthesis glycosyltransferase